MEQFLLWFVSIVEWHKTEFGDLSDPIYRLYRRIVTEAETCRNRWSHLCKCIWVLIISLPNLYSLRKMIRICEKYAGRFRIIYCLILVNPIKLLCYNLSTDSILCIKLCGEIVEIVNNEKHLDNKLFNNIFITEICLSLWETFIRVVTRFVC